MSGLDKHVRQQLGSHVRGLRKARGLKLADLAGAIGVSSSALSQIERGVVEPSLGTLWRLNDVLGSSLFDFFNDPAQTRVQVCRPSDRTLVEFDRYRYQTLVQATRRRLDLFLIELEPGEEHVRPPLSHYGEECGLVIEGTMEVLVADEPHLLEVGDAIWFDSTLPHTFRAVGPKRAVGVWTNTLPERPGDRDAARPISDGLAGGLPGR